MNLNDRIVDVSPTVPTGTGLAGQAGQANQAGQGTPPTPAAVDDNHPLRWIVRGMMVGAALGLSAGSIIPFLGTLIGGGLGLSAGFCIGVAMALFAAITRKLFPTSPRAIEIRERIACLLIIWSPQLVPASRSLVIPAVLGSIHALAAGTPTRFNTYAGEVSPMRRRVCNWLPWVILGIISAGWVIAMTVVTLKNN
jgi:hypothetical protein